MCSPLHSYIALLPAVRPQKRAKEGWARIQHSGESGRMQTVREMATIQTCVGRTCADSFSDPTIGICDSPVDVIRRLCHVSAAWWVLTRNESARQKERNYWAEMSSDCFVIDCLPTLGNRLLARLILLLVPIGVFSQTEYMSVGYALCHVRSVGIHCIRIGYTLVDVTVLASVMSQRYVRS